MSGSRESPSWVALFFESLQPSHAVFWSAARAQALAGNLWFMWTYEDCAASAPR